MPKSDLISLALQTKGYHWLMNHQKPQDIVRVGSSLFVLSTQANVGTDLKSNVKQYLQGKKTGFYESFDDWKFLNTNTINWSRRKTFF